MLFVDLWGEVYSAVECSLVNIVSYTLFSFELAILNVLHSFQDFSKQKLCIKSRILLHVKKGNSYKQTPHLRGNISIKYVGHAEEALRPVAFRRRTGEDGTRRKPLRTAGTKRTQPLSRESQIFWTHCGRSTFVLRSHRPPPGT